MNRILAFVLILCLPCFAAAEDAYGITLSASVDEALFTQYILQSLAQNGSEATDDELAPVIASVLNGLVFSLVMQENAAALSLTKSGNPVIDVTVYDEASNFYTTSTLMPGAALVEARTDNGSQEDNVITKLENTDWTPVLGSMSDAFSQWMSVIEPISAKGVYSGDAFSGGSQCTTIVLSDMDIAALITGLATPELRAALQPVCEALAIDLFVQFDAENARVADEDRYLYMLRIVTDDNDEFVGASLTILDNAAQFATISYGVKGKQHKLVVGLGANDQQNYWWEFTAKHSQLKNVTYYSGTSREWAAAKEDAFSSVCATYAPVNDLNWRCSVTKSGARYLWDGNVTVGTESYYEYLYSFSGSYTPTTCELDCSFSLGDSPYIPLTVRFSLTKAVPIPDMPDGLTYYDGSNQDETDAVIKQMTSTLLARLIKILPMDLIMQMNEFILPH